MRKLTISGVHRSREAKPESGRQPETAGENRFSEAKYGQSVSNP
jgi:hypothetical protein